MFCTFYLGLPICRITKRLEIIPCSIHSFFVVALCSIIHQFQIRESSIIKKTKKIKKAFLKVFNQKRIFIYMSLIEDIHQFINYCNRYTNIRHRYYMNDEFERLHILDTQKSNRFAPSPLGSPGVRG